VSQEPRHGDVGEKLLRVEWGLVDEVLDQPPKAWRELLSR
jgi:hypothetical protein